MSETHHHYDCCGYWIFTGSAIQVRPSRLTLSLSASSSVEHGTANTLFLGIRPYGTKSNAVYRLTSAPSCRPCRLSDDRAVSKCQCTRRQYPTLMATACPICASRGILSHATHAQPTAQVMRSAPTTRSAAPPCRHANRS